MMRVAVSDSSAPSIEPPASPATAPYRASWVDRLIDRIAALPGPAWVPYLIVSVVGGLAVHVAAWIEGFVGLHGLVEPGEFDLLLGSLAIYVIASVGGIHFLDHRASLAWTTFRPVAAVTDEDADRIVFELTTLPARAALGWTIVGLAVAVLTLAGGYGETIEFATAPLTFVVTTALGTFAYVTGALLVYHTIRQLRLIGRLPRFVERIDLLDAGPLHAFSGVTALTGAFFVAAAYFSVLTDPTTLTNPAVAAVNGIALVLGIGCFVLPLYGMQRRIAAEKARRLSAVSQRLDRALRDLARRNEAGDLTDADAVNRNIASVLAERDLIARTPTWPWSSDTLRGFSTALILPIALWLIFRVLERALA
jgi:hypothetical protein